VSISDNNCARPAAVTIAGRLVGPGAPAFVIAEMSANHQHDFERAVDIIHAAKEAGADAVKLQTYTADTLTIDCDKDYFRIKGTIWEGRNLYSLYQEAFTPWEWQPRLKQIAEALGLVLFSSPLDATAVDFLEDMGVPCHKVTSFELVDLPLIRKIAATGKPTIMSTGMAVEAEIDEAVRAFREAGGTDLVLLKCTSAYPAPPEDMNLKAMARMEQRHNCPVGLSDHSLSPEIAVAAVALGASVIEKHLCLDRSSPGPDSSFSLEPQEFKNLVSAIRTVEKALGQDRSAPSAAERASAMFRRSLFVVRDMKAGETFSPENLRSIRPGHGLHTRHYEDILGRTAAVDIPRGTPLSWDIVSGAPARDTGDEA
jgi:N-acetylneuraminate synthase